MATTQWLMHHNRSRIKAIEAVITEVEGGAGNLATVWNRTLGFYDTTADALYEALHLESASHIYQTATMWFVNPAALRSSEVYPHLVYVNRGLYRRDLEEAGADNNSTIIRTTAYDIPYVFVGMLTDY